MTNIMSKRPIVTVNHLIDKVFPIISWLKCEFCNFEFRRERMYRRDFGQFGIGSAYAYSCQTCSSSIQHYGDQIDHLRDSMIAILRGNPPPGPPIRTYSVK